MGPYSFFGNDLIKISQTFGDVFIRKDRFPFPRGNIMK